MPPDAPIATPETAAPDTIEMVDRSGQLVAVPREKAAAAHASGQLGWKAGEDLHIIDPSTQLLRAVKPEEAGAFLENGAQLAPKADVEEHARQEKYGGIGGAAAAVGEGAARGLSAGLSDPLAVHAAQLFGGDEAAAATRTHLAEIQRANPNISVGSELVGAVAPMFVGDEAGIADVIGSIPRTIDGAGQLAGHIAGNLVGEGAEHLAGKAIQKGVRGAAEAMVQGGLWSAGQEISDATLQNRPLVAENIIDAAGHGALIAGALGGALGAASPVASHVFDKLVEHAPSGDALVSAADEQYVRALSANKKGLIEDLKDNFGRSDGVKTIADRIRSEGIVSAGDTVEKIATKAAKAQADAIEGLSSTVQRVGADGVKLGDVISSLEERAKQFEGELGHRAAAGAIREQIRDLKSIYEPYVGGISAGPEIARAGEMTEEGVHEIGEHYGFGVSFGDDVAKTMNKVFDGNPPSAQGWGRIWGVPEEGIEVHPSRFIDEDGKLTVHANIYKGGEQVGDLEHTFERTRNGELHVKHDVIELKPEAQGQGIGRAINAQSEKAYQDLGVHQVNLDAAMSGGRVAQARYGYSWADSETAGIEKKFSRFLRENGIAPTEAEAMAGAARQGARAVSDVEAGGRQLGREFLNEQNWRGSKRFAQAATTPASDIEIPINDLLRQRRLLEGTVDWKTDSVRAKGMRAAGRTIEDSIMLAGEGAAKKAGAADGEWLKEYKDAKARFREVRYINEVADDAATAALRNRKISPSDYATSLMGSHLGGMLGAAGGHAVGGGVGGLLMGVAHHAARTRGNATLAVMLDKLGTFGGLSELHAGAMSRLDGTIASAIEARTAPKIKSKDYSESRFKKAAENVARHAVSGPAVDAHLAGQVAPIAGHSPELASEVRMKAAAAIKYLNTKLPPGYGQQQGPTLTPNVKAPVSKPAMQSFLKAVDAVESGPEETLKRVLRGHGGLDEVDALRATSPAYFAEAQQRVMAACSSRKKPLPYQTVCRLGILFDEPTDASLDPQAIQQTQAIYAPKSQGGAPGPAGAPHRRGSTTKPLKLASAVSGMFEPASGAGKESA